MSQSQQSYSIISCHTEVNQWPDLTLVKDQNKSQYTINGDKGKLVVMLSPSHKDISTMHQGYPCYGLKTFKEGDAPSLGVPLSEPKVITFFDSLHARIQYLLRLQEPNSNINPVVKFSVMTDINGTDLFDCEGDPIYRPVILNIKTKFNKFTNQIQSLFLSRDGLVDNPLVKLPAVFRADYYIHFDNISLGKNGTWYINYKLHSCYVK